MKGEITRIDITKQSHTGDYKRVYFKLEDGKFAKTDLVSSFRNYQRWAPLLKVGNVLGNLQLKPGGVKVLTVNADSYPTLIKKVEKIPTIEEDFLPEEKPKQEPLI